MRGKRPNIGANLPENLWGLEPRTLIESAVLPEDRKFCGRSDRACFRSGFRFARLPSLKKDTPPVLAEEDAAVFTIFKICLLKDAVVPAPSRPRRESKSVSRRLGQKCFQLPGYGLQTPCVHPKPVVSAGTFNTPAGIIQLSIDHPIR